MMLAFRAGALLAFLCGAVGAPAAAFAACPAGTKVHADFAKPNHDAWSASPLVQLQPSKLTITPKRGSLEYTINQTRPVSGGTICTTVLNHAGDTEDEDGGLIFWASVNETPLTFYTFSITPNGEFAVFLFDNHVQHVVVPPKRSAAIRRGADVPNELRVAVTFDTATAFINGTKVATLKGGGKTLLTWAGLFAESNLPAQSAWTFLGYDLSD